MYIHLVTKHDCADSQLLAIPQSIFNASCLQLIDLLFTREDQRMRKRHELACFAYSIRPFYRPAASKHH